MRYGKLEIGSSLQPKRFSLDILILEKEGIIDGNTANDKCESYHSADIHIFHMGISVDY